MAVNSPASSSSIPGRRRPIESSRPSIYVHVRDTADASKGDRLIFALNGKSWPYTERMTYTLGDSVRWRVVNFGGGEHPMHLHGFYFRVESRGDGGTERAIRSQRAAARRHRAGSGLSSPFELSGRPIERGTGCSIATDPIHVAAARIDDVFDRKTSDEHHDMGPAEHHAMTGMGGLVLGVTVLPAHGAVSAGEARVDAGETRSASS